MYVKLRKLLTQNSWSKVWSLFLVEAQITKLLIACSCRDERTRWQKISVVQANHEDSTWWNEGTLHKVLLFLSHISFEPRRTQTIRSRLDTWVGMCKKSKNGQILSLFQMWGKVFPNLLGAKKNWMFMVMREVGEWARILERFVTLMTPFADDNSINSNLCASHTKIQHQQQN